MPLLSLAKCRRYSTLTSLPALLMPAHQAGSNLGKPILHYFSFYKPTPYP